jgi:hypothetical protein
LPTAVRRLDRGVAWEIRERVVLADQPGEFG